MRYFADVAKVLITKGDFVITAAFFTDLFN